MSRVTPSRWLGVPLVLSHFRCLMCKCWFLGKHFASKYIDWAAVGGLALAGIVTAPFAALLAGKLSAKGLGIFVSITIIVINGSRIILA